MGMVTAIELFWSNKPNPDIPHVRVALQIPVCLCVYVDLLPPSPLLQSSNLRCMAMAFFFSWALSGTMGGKLRGFWEGGSVGVVQSYRMCV